MAKNAPSRTRSVIAVISAGPLAKLLKDSGFKRRSPNFWRETEGIFQSISFQASQWGSHKSGSFTLNLGVTSPALYKGYTGRVLPKNPAGLLWPINRRIGSLMESRRDLWWDVDESVDTSKLGQDVATKIESYALPFLDKLRTPQQLHAAVQNDESVTGLTDAQLLMVRAVLAAQLGEKDSARILLDEAIKKYQGKPFEATVRKIATALAPQL